MKTFSRIISKPSVGLVGSEVTRDIVIETVKRHLPVGSEVKMVWQHGMNGAEIIIIPAVRDFSFEQAKDVFMVLEDRFMFFGGPIVEQHHEETRHATDC